MMYIYTCIFGDKDTLNEEINTQGVKAICFTDQDIKSDVWEIRKLPDVFSDKRRTSRIAKMLPHLLLPDATHSLYVDGNIISKVPLQRMIDEFLQDTDIAFFKHPNRDCYFDEAKECIRLELDDKKVIEDQMIRYKDVPRHFGLWQGGVIFRKHTPKVKIFNETWFAEYCLGSRRDQLSLPIAIYKTGTPAKGIEGHPFTHQYFEMVPHKIPSEWAGKI